MKYLTSAGLALAVMLLVAPSANAQFPTTTTSSLGVCGVTHPAIFMDTGISRAAGTIKGCTRICRQLGATCRKVARLSARCYRRLNKSEVKTETTVCKTQGTGPRAVDGTTEGSKQCSKEVRQDGKFVVSEIRGVRADAASGCKSRTSDCVSSCGFDDD